MWKVLDPYRWLIGGGILVAIAAGGVVAWQAHKTGLINEGKEQLRVEQLVTDNRSLVLQQKKIIGLIAENERIQDELNAIEQTAIAFERDRFAAERVRDNAKRSAAIANATAGALRGHATQASIDFDRSEEHVKRFGLEAVRASAVAYSLHDTLQARRREPMKTPSMPTNPFNKPKE